MCYRRSQCSDSACAVSPPGRQGVLCDTQSPEHLLQLLQSPLDGGFDLGEGGENRQGRSMLHIRGHDFLVTIETEVVSVTRDLSFGNTEALLGSGAAEFASVPVSPTPQRIRQVVLSVVC